MMTKKWTTPERESIAYSAIACLEQHGYWVLNDLLKNVLTGIL